MNVQRRSLRRSKSNCWIAGVCGGLSDFFGINPFWFRSAMVIIFILGGVPSILVYIIAMIMIPSE